MLVDDTQSSGLPVGILGEERLALSGDCSEWTARRSSLPSSTKYEAGDGLGQSATHEGPALMRPDHLFARSCVQKLKEFAIQIRVTGVEKRFTANRDTCDLSPQAFEEEHVDLEARSDSTQHQSSLVPFQGVVVALHKFLLEPLGRSLS